MNARESALRFTLPALEWGASWEVVLDTADPIGAPRDRALAGVALELAARSLVVLRRPSGKA